MKIRFLGDENLDQAIIDGLCRREPSVDFMTARAACIGGLPDEQVLAIAADQQRVLVTHDQSTMGGAFGAFLKTHQSSGVIIIPSNMGIGIAVEQLLLVWSVENLEDWTNRFVYLKFLDSWFPG
jgi:hypothetical protein